MKTKLIAPFIFIALINFSFLGCNTKENLSPSTKAKLRKLDSLESINQNNRQVLGDLMKKFVSVKIDKDFAERYYEAFNKKYPDDTFSPIYFDGDVLAYLKSLSDLSQVNGFYVYPLLYPKTVSFPGERIPSGRFGKVTLLFAIVDKNGNIIKDNLYDYGNPCKPNCPALNK